MRKMKKFMMSLPEAQYEAIEKLVKLGYCSSVQEYIREAVREKINPLLQGSAKEVS